VQDALGESVGKRFGYATVGESGVVEEAGPAPYLDYSPATDLEIKQGQELAWLTDSERSAVSWIIAQQLPGFASDVIARRSTEFERVRERVSARLNREVNRLETEALKADADSAAGKKVRRASEGLRRQADELDKRRASRLATIERQLSMAPLPPRITAIALVMPATPTLNVEQAADADARAAIERRGVDAVLAAEVALGRSPEEQSHNNPGFDVLSRTPDGPSIRIEVKARIAGADTFTITRTEVLMALNSAPDHRLALVRVSELGSEHDELRYIGGAFDGVEPASLTDFNVVSQNLSWKAWWDRGVGPF